MQDKPINTYFWKKMEAFDRLPPEQRRAAWENNGRPLDQDFYEWRIEQEMQRAEEARKVGRKLLNGGKRMG